MINDEDDTEKDSQHFLAKIVDMTQTYQDSDYMSGNCDQNYHSETSCQG